LRVTFVELVKDIGIKGSRCSSINIPSLYHANCFMFYFFSMSIKWMYISRRRVEVWPCFSSWPLPESNCVFVLYLHIEVHVYVCTRVLF